MTSKLDELHSSEHLFEESRGCRRLGHVNPLNRKSFARANLAIALSLRRLVRYEEAGLQYQACRTLLFGLEGGEVVR